jgi:hypothetical protein
MPSISKVSQIYQANSSRGYQRHPDSSLLNIASANSSSKNAKRDEDKKSFRSILEEKIKAV